MILVQEAVINTLLNNTTLQTMLGFVAPSKGGVSEDKSFIVDKTHFPRIHVSENADTPIDVEQIALTNGKGPDDIFFDIKCFSTNATSKEVGQIEQEIRVILNGSIINYTGITITEIEREGFYLKDRDPEGFWYTITRYKGIAELT